MSTPTAKKTKAQLPFFLRLLKKCAVPFAILIITMAIVFSLFRALTPWAKQYKGRVEQHLSQLLGQPVTINDMETSWYWFEPVLKMDDVTLSGTNDHILKLNKLLVGIDLLSSLWHWQIQPGVLYVDNIHLSLHQKDNHWEIDGLGHTKQMMSTNSESYLPILTWVLNQQKIVIKNVSLRIHLKDGTILPLRELNAVARRAYGHYRVKGSGMLLQKIPTTLDVMADMQLNPKALNEATIHGYVSVQHLLPAKWKQIIPDFSYHVNEGEGSMNLWFDINKGHFTDVQSSVDLSHIVWTETGKAKTHHIESLQANLAWKAVDNGWQFSSDKLKLNIDGVSWPENALIVNYKKSDQTYSAFIKTLSLQAVLHSDIEWPKAMAPLLERHPVGELHDTQVVIQSGQPTYLLTRFENLGWIGNEQLPSVSQLSGVLHWQPSEGRLELDGKHTLIRYKKMPETDFDELNMDLEWKDLSNGRRFSLDRFILTRPDLVLSAQGSLDAPFTPTANLRMTAEFSASDASHWLDYIPSGVLKPKLETWLKQDIKKIDKASGRVIVNGLLADFPFDKAPGEFSINSYLTGLDLLINEHWPLNKDIEASLTVDKRTLEANIFHADLQGVVVDKMSLVINDIGLGEESLLIHGDINAPGDKIKAYVYNTPVGSRLTRWKMLDMNDTLGLDLHLEIPLYPASDHVFAKGALTFDNNQFILHYPTNQLVLNDVSGELSFDEYGVSQSVLNGSLSGEPVALTIQSVRKPKEYIKIKVDGATSTDFLNKKLGFPVFSVMKGHLNLTGLMIITQDPHDLDHVHVKSSLKGVSINLPEPLGKTSKEVVPLTLDIDFNDQKNLDFGFKYKNIVVKASRLTMNQWDILFKQNDVTAKLMYEPLTNTLSGNIDKIYLSNLLSLKNKMRMNASPLKPNSIPNLNLTINQVDLNQVNIGSLELKSTSSVSKWVLDYCKIKTDEYLLTLQGAWNIQGNKDNTTVDADLQIYDLGKALARWSITPAVDAHKGHVVFKGGWPLAVHDFSLTQVTGSMLITLKNGRIINLDKATEEKLGLGKLLSILSLQTIPRRLQLDFSDLSKDGYSFDVFNGNFTLHKGVLTTTDSYLDGPVAYAGMKGDLDVVNHVYDIDLRVSPYITASLPIVATIVGGPIAGIATWVASKIINKGMQQISAYTYKISGPWLNPVVQQVHIYRKKTTMDAPVVQKVSH